MAANESCKGLKRINPVQGLVEYVQDIKPYHSKVIEVLIEYVNEDFINLTLTDGSELDVDITKQADQFSFTDCNPGFSTEPFGGSTSIPIATPNKQDATIGDFVYGFLQSAFAVPGDQRGVFKDNDQIRITSTIEDYSNLASIVSVNEGSAGNGSFVVFGDQTNNSKFTPGNVVYTVGSERSRYFTVTSVDFNVPTQPEFIHETQTASSDGQSVFTLSNSFVQDGNHLLVFVNGIKEIINTFYEETDSNEITVIESPNPVEAGDRFDFYVDQVTSTNVLEREIQTGLSGTPTISFDEIDYQVGSENLIVFYNGQKMIRGLNYEEIDSVTINWLTPGLITADSLEFYANIESIYEAQTTSEQQSVFTLDNDFLQDKNHLLVFINGQKKTPGVFYQETSSNEITIIASPNPIQFGELIEFYIVKPANNNSNTTTIDVEQAVTELDNSLFIGLTKAIDNSLTGDYTVNSVTFEPGMIDSWPDTTDPESFIVGNSPHTIIGVEQTFSTPTLSTEQFLVSSVTEKPLSVQAMYGFSNFSPNMRNSPDEGSVYQPIVGIQTSSLDNNDQPIPDSGKVTVDGNFQVSNLMDGDTITITQTSSNNGTYTITSITYDQMNSTTTFGVEELISDSTVEGIIQTFIPANMFAVNDNYTQRFISGQMFTVNGGTHEGTYTTMYSVYRNGQTWIRPVETLFVRGTGLPIVKTTSNNEFVVLGDRTDQFTEGSTFVTTRTVSNDGTYEVVSPGATFDAPSNTTTIPVNSELSFVANDPSSGELFSTVHGAILKHHVGFSEQSNLCDVSSESVANLNIEESLSFEGLALELTDDIIAYNLENTDRWGYDLPSNTILSTTEPPVPEQNTAPSSPSLNDLWFDTSTNTFRQYTDSMWKPIVTAFWLDTNEELFYYRSKNKYVDTGWVIYIVQTPGFSAQFPSDGSSNPFVYGYSIEPHKVYHKFVTVDTTNNAFIIAGGSWASRFYCNFQLEGYSIGSGGQLLGQWNVPCYSIYDVDPRAQSITVFNDLTWLFSSGRVLFVNRSETSNWPYTVQSSSYDGMTNTTTITVQEPITSEAGYKLERPIQILAIDQDVDNIEVRGDVGDRYPPGTQIVIDKSTTNNGTWTVSSTSYNNGTDITTITLSEDIPDDDMSGNATLQTFIQQKMVADFITIQGAVDEPSIGGTGPYDTQQPKTVVSVTNPVDTNVDSIVYEWFGPLRTEITEHSKSMLNVTTSDKMYIDGTLFSSVSTFDILDTDASANQIYIEFDDPQTGLDVDLTDKFPAGTIFTIDDSFGENIPSSSETNDAMYAVKNSQFDINSGKTVITVEDNFDKLPPFNTFTVENIKNNVNGVPAQIFISGDHVRVFDTVSSSEQFRTDPQLLSNNDPLQNVITVTDAAYDSTNNRTILNIAETLDNTSFTGTISVVRAEYRANIFYDETNATLPWSHGQVKLGATAIDEGVTNATIIDIVEFGWGTTETWEIVATDQSASTVTISGDQTSILDVNDDAKIIGSYENNGSYMITQVVYDSANNQTVVTLDPPLPTDPPADLMGYLQVQQIDITDWFQYLIQLADADNNKFFVFGNATSNLQSGQQFLVRGTVSNNGVYVAETAPVYDTQTGQTEISVSSISDTERGGWLQSYRDHGMSFVMEDRIGIDVAEVADAAVLETAGSMIGAWDFDYFNVGGFDESSGTVIHLYSNTFSS